MWDLGRVTRNFPTVVIVDDHDVYQGDLWGDSGAASPNGVNKEGGYVHEPEFVRMVERTQTAANPDAAPMSELKQGLTNYFTSFKVGDVDVALIEDRKFKSFPTIIGSVEKSGSKIIDKNFDPSSADVPGAQLLGAEQEAFLQKWVRSNPERVKVGLTQTTYASLHTDPAGTKWPDIDSGGWPQSARNRAVEILAEGQAVLMAGDTHLPAVLQHGVKKHGDGVWQFTVPAVANKYRRWWTPKDAGENQRPGAPLYSGNYEDGFGNLITVAAVGNPKISNYDVFLENKRRGKGYASEHLMLDAAQTKDGYGLIVISPDRKTVTFECWPADPADGSPAKQHDDWPVVLKRSSSNENWQQAE